MSECIFCKIINKKLPSNIRYEDNYIIAFDDIHPKAPVHILIIPKRHISSLFDLDESVILTMGKIVFVAKKLATDLNILNGFRLISNCGKDGLQDVKHVHFHLMGGRKLCYPIG